MREAPIRLDHPCDACGNMVGGGFNYCPDVRLLYVAIVVLNCCGNKKIL